MGMAWLLGWSRDPVPGLLNSKELRFCAGEFWHGV